MRLFLELLLVIAVTIPLALFLECIVRPSLAWLGERFLEWLVKD